MRRVIAIAANTAVSIDLQCNYNVSILNIVWLFIAGNLIKMRKNPKGSAAKERLKERLRERDWEKVESRNRIELDAVVSI